MSGEDRYFRFLVRLLPESFRERHQDELLPLLEKMKAELGPSPGKLRVLRLYVAVTWDVLRPTRRLAVIGAGGVEADLRLGARNLLRRPALATATVLTIALGIGATTTIFSVVDGVVLRPLPYDDPSTLVAIGAMAPGASADPRTGLQDLSWVSFPGLNALRARARSFETVAAIGSYGFQESDENGVQAFVPAATVTGEVFPMLGVTPALGRTFAPDELVFTVGWHVPVVLLTHGYWQRRYGGDAGVLGRPLEAAAFDGTRPTIVGILPEGFEPPESFFPTGQLPEIYAPLALPWTADPAATTGTFVYLRGLGRLASGATIEGARAEAAEISRELGAYASARPLPGTTAELPMGVNGLHADTLGTSARPLWAFFAAAGLLLLLTALNAVTLLLARALDRRQELGVRIALGAGRGRVVRLLLGEAGVLAVTGGAIGILLAYAGVEAFLRFAPPTLPRLGAVAVDVRVLVVALATTIVTGIAAGLVPALGFLRRNAWEGLQAGARAVSDPASRVRTALVAAQLALAMVLLCGAGLFFTSFMRLRSADPGFEPEGLIVMSEGPSPGVRRWEPRTFHRRWDPVLAAQAAVPGVLSVAGASNVPFQTPTWAPRIRLPGDDPERVREGIVGYAITPGLLETMGIALVAGRGFGAEDGPDAERVVLVNEAFVRTQMGGADALGTMITRDFEVLDIARRPIPMRIVGVVEDVVQTRAEDGPRAAIYIPYTQAPAYPLGEWWPVVRTNRAPEGVIPELRAALVGTQFNPENLSTMADRIGRAQITPRFQSMLIGAFALIALLLAAVGLHGSLAHTVRRRQRELGVRMALGADRSSVLRMVMREGMSLSAIALALGLLGSLAMSRVLASFLFDMQPWDPPTLLAVAAILLLVSAVACFAPARRATAVDPVKVLGAE